MSDDEIKAMAARLESEVRVEDAKFRVVQPGGGLDGTHIAANRAGYLRFAALFLQAAVAPYRENSADILDLESDKFIDPLSDVSFDHFERREDLWPDARIKPVIDEKSDRLFFLVAPYCVLSSL